MPLVKSDTNRLMLATQATKRETVFLQAAETVILRVETALRSFGFNTLKTGSNYNSYV